MNSLLLALFATLTGYLFRYVQEQIQVSQSVSKIATLIEKKLNTHKIKVLKKKDPKPKDIETMETLDKNK